MAKIFIPTSEPNDWRRFLAEPDKHWKTGNSARALAHCWQEADDIPQDVKNVLAIAPELSGLEAFFCVPEYQVPLPGGSRPSQSDVWILGRTNRGLISIAVEGKVSESFGPTIDDWFEEASAGKEVRLRFLCEELGIAFPPPSNLRYQLFHRTASAIIEAKKFRACDAAMVVHTFSPSNAWFEDFETFSRVLGINSGINQINSKQISDSVCLHVAWVHGNEKWLRV